MQETTSVLPEIEMDPILDLEAHMTILRIPFDVTGILGFNATFH